MKRAEIQNTIYNPIIETDAKGFADASAIEDYKGVGFKTTIPIGMEYRPDLIAKEFLNDPNLAWVITAANNFTKGIKDYTPGRKIFIPDGF